MNQTKEVRLYSGEEVYCPYWEEGNPMLEIGLGCSWHRCKFCYFTNDGFSTFPLDEIDAKAKMLVPYAEGKTRLFLLGQNSLVQPTEKLVAVSEIVENHMPWIEEISTYARIDDVLRKSDAELKLLRHYKICHVHLGIESGDDETLAFMDKGITAEDILTACEKLQNAGIKYSFNIILGLGGKNRSEEHIRATADIINLCISWSWTCRSGKTPFWKASAVRADSSRLICGNSSVKQATLLTCLTAGTAALRTQLCLTATLLPATCWTRTPSCRSSTKFSRRRGW